MALYPDLAVLQGSIRRLETKLYDSDSEDDVDYVPDWTLDPENRDILPPPKLPRKRNPQTPDMATSGEYSVPQVTYAKIDHRKRDTKETRPTQGPLSSNDLSQHSNGDSSFKSSHSDINGNLENQGILPPPKLPRKLNPGNDSVHQVTYATIAHRKRDTKETIPSHRPLTTSYLPEHSQSDSSVQGSSHSDSNEPIQRNDQNPTGNAAPITQPAPPPRAAAPRQTDDAAAAAHPQQYQPFANEFVGKAKSHEEDIYGTAAPGKQAVIQWFNNTQSNSLKDQKTSVIPTWFHGLITRVEAENRLEQEPIGCFLVRFSESRFGYSLSIRAEDRIRHYMIDKDTKTKKYLIVNEILLFGTFRDLIEYYKRNSVSTWGGYLTKACGEDDRQVVYDNAMGMRRRLENEEHSNSNGYVPSSGISPNMVASQEQAPARPPRAVPRKAQALPPLPPARVKFGKTAHLTPCRETTAGE